MTNNDITAIRIQLNELKSKFDRSMREGETFGELRVIHMQIKEMECYLNAMEWDADVHANTGSRYAASEKITRRDYERRYRHVDEPPPLL
jgi:hypothetical protein